MTKFDRETVVALAQKDATILSPVQRAIAIKLLSEWLQELAEAAMREAL